MFAPDPASAVRLSLIVGLWCAALGFPVAILLGWLLARRRFPGKAALATLVMAPLVVPPVVTGCLLLKILSPASPLGAALGRAGIEIPFTLAGAVLGAFVVGLPLYVLAARVAIEGVDRKLEEVSWTLGRAPIETFRRITLPLALPGLMAGAVLAFARALGEFGATIALAGNIEGRTRTIALAVYALMEAPGGERSLGTLLWSSLALSFAALLAYELLLARMKRRMESA